VQGFKTVIINKIISCFNTYLQQLAPSLSKTRIPVIRPYVTVAYTGKCRKSYHDHNILRYIRPKLDHYICHKMAFSVKKPYYVEYRILNRTPHAPIPLSTSRWNFGHPESTKCKSCLIPFHVSIMKLVTLEYSRKTNNIIIRIK
jgi:hypothetical protein